MRFAHPEILNALWLLIPFILLCWILFRQKQKMMENFAQPQLLKELMQNFSIEKYYFKFISFIAVFIFSILALARPQWGFEWQEIKRQGIDVLVAIDVSRSMLTQDVRPSRLERTKLAVKDLVKKLEGDRIGLIAFAGEAFLVCPLTVDYGGFLMTLEDLSPESVSRGGTAVSKAIEEAIRVYDDVPSKYKNLIIMTDGENLEGDPLKSAQDAKKRGIKIFSIGIGTQEGELIQVANQYGQSEFLKDEQGNFVKSRLNEDLLQKIALTTGGAYVRASGAEFGLDLIYDRELSRLEKREFDSKKEKRYYERFQFPLAVAVFFLLLDSFLIARGPVKKILLLVMIMWQVLSIPGWAAPLAKEVNDANRLYQEREYEQALKKYQGAYEKQPNSDIINFNLGTALYRARRYPEALEHLQKSLLTDDKDLKAKAYFNLADTYYRLGIQYEDKDTAQAIKILEKALEEVHKSLSLNKEDKAAQDNRDFIESEIRRLKRLPPPQEKQKQEQKNKEQDNQEQKQQNQQDQQSSEPRDQQKQEQESSPQAQQPADQQKAQQEQQNSATAAQEKKEKLKQEEAERLLEQYQANEEPEGMLNLRGPRVDEQPVLKDW